MEGNAFCSNEVRVSPEGQEGGSAERRGAISSRFARGLAIGFTGGLAATIVMDLFGAGLFLMLGGPASLSFSIIGDSAAAFFALVGVSVAGGFPLGALLHYVIGIVLGALFGAILSRTTILNGISPGRFIALGVIYVEGMSLPMLTTAAFVLKMTQAETAQWFGISFVMHLVYGVVLGAIAGLWVRDS